MKTSIEIGISAYNEEANIEHLLQSIYSENQDTFDINRVTLISDGSTDRTVEIAYTYKLYSHTKLVIIDSPDRLGKSARVNELFKKAKSDILVIFDADVVLHSNKTILYLIKPILNGRATLTSGHPEKISSHTFTDHVMDVSLFLQDQVKTKFKNGKSVYACHGRVIALRRKVYRDLEVPVESVGDDAYLYFYNKNHGKGFAYADKATVLFRMPQSLHDYISQQRRFSTTPKELASFFGDEILTEYKIPFNLSLSIMSSAFIRYHFYAIGYVLYRIIAKFSRFSTTSKWAISETTKRL